MEFQAQGMTACPCAQGLVEDGARSVCKKRDFSEDIDRIVDAVPLATHNQHGFIGPLYIGTPKDSGVDIDARRLLRIVETSMSARSTS